LSEIFFQKKIPTFITRKIAHIGSGIIVAFFPLLISLNTAIIIGVISSLFLIFTKKYKLLNSIHNIEKSSIGDIIFAPSLTLCAILFWPIQPILFQTGALVLGLSDGFAGLIGEKLKMKPYNINSKKTLWGSIIFFIITFIILLTVIYFQYLLSITLIFYIFISSLLLTIIEALLTKGWDNLFIPIAAGLIMYFLL